MCLHIGDTTNNGESESLVGVYLLLVGRVYQELSLIRMLTAANLEMAAIYLA